MSYTLIGSLRSPFVRVCRLLMIQNKIDFDFRVLDFAEDKKDAETLSKETPINKVPVLIDGSRKIFDSRVIVNFLIQRHKLRPLSLDEENIVSSVYGCLDAGVILFLMKRDGFDINGSGFFITRNRERIPANLNYLAPWASSLDAAKPEDWNYPSMSLFSFLYWGQAREILNLEDDPRLSRFMDEFSGAPGVRETGF